MQNTDIKRKPVLVLELANSRKPRRLSGERTASLNDQIESPEKLTKFLNQIQEPALIECGDLALYGLDMDEIRVLRAVIENIVAGIVETGQIPAKDNSLLNSISKACLMINQLNFDCSYSSVIKSGTLAGLMASICIREIGSCDIKRIKACCRPACGLYFYDTTRNRSALWHAEDPCGWRSRSERRGSKTSPVV